MYLLVTDTHLDDNPDNEYRWDFFKAVREAQCQYDVSHTFHLGDLVDRKDRFSSALVNRLLYGLKSIAPVTVLRGNHDTTLHPPNYFSFLNAEFVKSNINYIDQPTSFGDGSLLLLPFSARPKIEWKGINFRRHKCVFIHATVNGAVGENGMVFENPGFPMLPGDVLFYSGDVHTQQQVRNVIYVGCPHPINFGDNFPCRLLLIDESSFAVVHQIDLTPNRKLMINIKSIEDLARIKVRQGDQVKIRFSCDPSSISEFGKTEQGILEWAKKTSITVAGTEVLINSTYDSDVDTNQSPESILRQFAANEQLSNQLTDLGVSLLNEVL